MDSVSPLLEPLRRAIERIHRGVYAVRDRDSPSVVRLRPKPVQSRIMGEMLRQAQRGEPVRLIVPKFRRGGVSTIVQAVFRDLCDSIPQQRAGTFAQTDIDTRAIFDLARLMHASAMGGAVDTPETRIRFANGSVYEARTARSAGVMRGSGLTYLHLSELPYLQSVQGLDAAAVVALLNTVPDQPHTIVVIEGTGQGPTGEFYRRCLEAQAGGSSYRLVFLPWFDDPAYQAEPPAGFELDGEEATIRAFHGLTIRQMAWRRRRLKDAGAETAFKREFPATFEECFEAATGRVYPLFSPSRHVKRVDISGWTRYRAIDWGYADSPFCCLWLAFLPSGEPSFTVDPGCREFIREMLAYRYNEKTGRPQDEDDHGPDAARYGVTTFRLFGKVHIYREFYRNEATPADACAEVHRLSGWELPPGSDGRILAEWRRSTGEQYAGTVADRSQPGNISQWRQWGVSPLIGQVRFARPRRAGETQSRGEVQDGVDAVSQLLDGNADFFQHFEDKGRALDDRIQKAASERRHVWLTDDERRTLEVWRRENSPSYTGYDPAAEHGMTY